MGTGIKALTTGIQDQLEAMVRRANLLPAYLNRVVYKEYQKAQRDRWKTENVGPDFVGGQWRSLDPIYAAWKKKKYSSSPGGGTKLLIRTGTLVQSVVGPGEGHEKIVTNRSIRINTSVPYATYVDETRNFTQWSPVFYGRIYKGLSDYLLKNIMKEVTGG